MRLLERESSLASLDGWLADAAAGRGSLVLVTGEAGIGKSALVRAFGTGPTARAVAARVWFGGCEPLRTPRPLGPLRDIARAAGGELAGLVGGEGARHRIFAAFLDLLGGHPPSVAVFEDVHWADEATLDLLLFLGRRIADSRAVVVATFREDEVGRDHPLQVVLGDLATAGTIRRQRVEPLSRVAVADLAEPAGLDPDRLYALTGGNPFFVTEVVATPDQAVPPSVRDAVLARAARLSPAARSTLDVAAAVPDHVEVTLLLAAAGVGSSALDECVRAGILRTEGVSARFRHELARVAFEQAIPDGHRTGIHARILARLTDGHAATAAPSNVDIARLAYHADEAGDADAVLAHAPAAAEQAAALGAHRAAAEHYARALRHADRLPPAERAGLWELLAAERACIADTSDSIEAAGHALALWREVGDRERQALVVARSASYLWGHGRVAEAHAAAAEAIALLADAPPGAAAAIVHSYLAILRMLARDFTGAIAAGRTAIGLAERFPAPQALSRALNAVGSSQWFVDPDEAPATMQRCLQVARAAGDDVTTAGAMGNFGSGAGEVRRYDVADHWLRESIAFAAERDLDAYRLYNLAWLARTQFEQGNWSLATDLVTETIGQWPAGPSAPVPDMGRVPNADRVALTVLGRLRVRRGDPDPDTPLDRAWELAVQTGDLQRLWPVAAARAERAWLAGRPEVAPLVADSLDLAARLGHAWALGELAYWLWRVGELADPPPGAAEPYAAQIAGEPERAARLWEELGCPYEAAVARAETDEPEQMLHALGELNRLGAWPAAERLGQRLRQLGVRNLPRRPRRATLEHPHRLTAREIEILELLPAGLRNADIAARLHISIRTVDHHISAILAKLGVASRRDAAEWAGRHAESGQRPGGK